MAIHRQGGRRLEATLDDLGLDRVSLLGHSFGGGIELGFAARSPDRVVELVFSDTLAASREWSLAHEVLRHPVRLVRLAAPNTASAFLRTSVDHPRQLVGAAWWGFTSGRVTDAEDVAGAGLPAHVLWANRDSILDSSDGRRFAHDLHASFTIASAPNGRKMDHDWMFQDFDVFFDHLLDLGLKALSASSRHAGRRPHPTRRDAASAARPSAQRRRNDSKIRRGNRS